MASHPSNNSAAHHVALRVSDLGRATRFYEDVFDARPMMRQFEIKGSAAATIAAGPKGISMKVQPLDFGGGGSVELFEFDGPRVGTGPSKAWEGSLIHFAIQVEDTAATLARAEAAGAVRLWPEIKRQERMNVIYIQDLDWNVVEIIDVSMKETMEITERAFFGG
jgi:catechol 2,3-dioxygenase-like lactoylglutathione lyase family enzyme